MLCHFFLAISIREATLLSLILSHCLEASINKEHGLDCQVQYRYKLGLYLQIHLHLDT